MRTPPPETASAIRVELGRSDYYEVQVVPRDLGVPSPVISPPLLAAVDPTDRHLVELVEERHGLIVLALPVLDHEPMLWVVRIDR
jgi:hypothetical protein